MSHSTTVQPARIYTAEDLERLSAQGYRYELDKGRLIEMAPAGELHGRTTNRAVSRLSVYIDDHDLGPTYSAESGFRLATDPDVVYAPDFAFVSKERDLGPQPTGFCKVVPDLVVETKSPDDSRAEFHGKLSRWLEYGVRAAVGIDPLKRTVVVFRPNADIEILNVQDVFSVEDVVSGFSQSVANLLPRPVQRNAGQGDNAE